MEPLTLQDMFTLSSYFFVIQALMVLVYLYSSRNSICSELIVSDPCLGWSTSHWTKHSNSPCIATIWGTVMLMLLKIWISLLCKSSYLCDSLMFGHVLCLGEKAGNADHPPGFYDGSMLLCRARLRKTIPNWNFERNVRTTAWWRWGYWTCNFAARGYGDAVCSKPHAINTRILSSI